MTQSGTCLHCSSSRGPREHSLSWPWDALTQVSAKLRVLDAAPHITMRWRLGIEQQGSCLAPRNGSQTCTLQARNGRRSGGLFWKGVGQLLKEKALSVILTPEDLLGPCLITMHWSPKETASSSTEKRYPSAPQHLPHMGMNNMGHQTFEREYQKPKWESRTKRNLQESETVWNMYETSRKWSDSLGV